jgi:hypothetical protein
MSTQLMHIGCNNSVSASEKNTTSHTRSYLLFNDPVSIEIDSVGGGMVNECGTVAGMRICRGRLHG